MSGLLRNSRYRCMRRPFQYAPERCFINPAVNLPPSTCRRTIGSHLTGVGEKAVHNRACFFPIGHAAAKRILPAMGSCANVIYLISYAIQFARAVGPIRPRLHGMLSACCRNKNRCTPGRPHDSLCRTEPRNFTPAAAGGGHAALLRGTAVERRAPTLCLQLLYPGAPQRPGPAAALSPETGHGPLPAIDCKGPLLLLHPCQAADGGCRAVLFETQHPALYLPREGGRVLQRTSYPNETRGEGI
jgi:hypothetical protein